MITYPNCKINLGLIIKSKRADGFHDIETVFYPVFELFDILEIIPSDEFAFSSSGIHVDGKTEDNICVKAYKLIKQDFDIPPVKIHLHKQIPIGAGLGGGSADGSFTLKMINELFALKLNESELEFYASGLGSDTSFFIKNKPVFAYGRGTYFDSDVLIPDLSDYRIVVRNLNIHVSTKEAYAGVVPNAKQKSIREIINQPIDQWRQLLVNQFEESVFKSHKEIEKAKNNLYDDGAIYASMSGSGSSVFGIYKR